MSVHPTAVVHDGARFGDGVEIGPWCVVGPKVVLGAGVRLISHAVIDGATEIGAETVVHPFAVLGGAPQHLGHKGEETRLVLGARNIVREHATMNTGTASGGGVTRVGDDNLFMTGAHVAHDCTVGSRVVFANNATLGGHAEVQDFVFLGGLSAVHQFGRVGRYAMIGGLTPVTRDVIPFGSVWGNPATLEGLNLVGLKRRGFSREAISTLRKAVDFLFRGAGSFEERVDAAERDFAGSPEASEVVAFVRSAGKRPLLRPGADA